MQNFYSRLIVSREINKTKAGKVFFESPFNWTWTLETYLQTFISPEN